MIRQKSIPIMLCTLFIGFGVVSASRADQKQGPCAQITAACQNAGFVQGGAKSGNGLQVDCVRPIMQGKPAGRKASKPLPQVDPQLVAACQAKNPGFGQPQAPPSQSGGEQPQASPGTGWPKELDANGTHFVIYQPQAESWKDGQLQSRSVVMISEATGKSRYGTISISAHTQEDPEHRSVTLENLEVVAGDFPSGASDQERARTVIRKHLSEWPRTMPLDRLRADVGIAEAENASEAVPLRNAPAKIIFSPRRAVLVQVDGEPAFRPVEGTKYSRVINTPAMILQDSSDQRLYLDGDGPLDDRHCARRSVERGAATARRSGAGESPAQQGRPG